MRPYRLLALAAIFIAAPLVAQETQSEPEKPHFSFDGIELGIKTPPDFSYAECIRTSIGDTWCNQPLAWPLPQSPDICVPLTLSYIYHGGVLVALYGTFGLRDYNAVRDGLLARYGDARVPPVSEITRLHDEILLWRFTEGTLRLYRFADYTTGGNTAHFEIDIREKP